MKSMTSILSGSSVVFSKCDLVVNMFLKSEIEHLARLEDTLNICFVFSPFF